LLPHDVLPFGVVVLPQHSMTQVGGIDCKVDVTRHQHLSGIFQDGVQLQTDIPGAAQSSLLISPLAPQNSEAMLVIHGLCKVQNTQGMAGISNNNLLPFMLLD